MEAHKPNQTSLSLWAMILAGNIGAYNQGLMAGRTPNLDKIAAEGMRFTDYYAEASCTAGRANFITGELPIRTGMTTVGQAGSQEFLWRQLRSLRFSNQWDTLQVSLEKIIWVIRTSFFLQFMDLMNSSVTCIIWMQWKIHVIPIILRTCVIRLVPVTWFTPGQLQPMMLLHASLGKDRKTKDRRRRYLVSPRMETVDDEILDFIEISR